MPVYYDCPNSDCNWGHIYQTRCCGNSQDSDIFVCCGNYVHEAIDECGYCLGMGILIKPNDDENPNNPIFDLHKDCLIDGE